MKKVTVTDIFKQNFESTSSTVVNRGGARSSKSYSIHQLIIHKITNEVNKKFLLTMKTTPALIMVLYKEFIDLLKYYDYYRYFEHNKSNKVLTYLPNGSFIQFTSFDDPSKMRSTEWNYVFMEEANNFSYDDYMTLKLRMSAQNDLMNQIYMAFNPTDAFSWIKTKLLDVEEDVQEILSTYKDNPFLSRQYIEYLESIKENNPTYWTVFGEGEWGTLDEIIYNNYTIVKVRPTPEETIYGIDFGYNNSTALIKIDLSDNEYYLEQMLYQTGLTNNDLIAKLKYLIRGKHNVIYADCAEPARIEEIKRAGFNIVPADKSVTDGLDFCKRSTLYIHYKSIDLIKEIRAYSYRKDRNGRVWDDPVKFNDHLMDAMRYGLYSHYGKPQRTFEVYI